MKASACAKLILFGEHSVVYGQPAIAVPLRSIRLKVELKKSSQDKVSLKGVNASDSKRVLSALLIARQQHNMPYHLRLRIDSGIPLKCGMGSSAALSVAVTSALSKSKDPSTVAAAALELERVFHGTPSGIDVAVSAYEKPVFFIRGKKPIFIRIRPMWILVANSGGRTPTRTVVQQVRMKLQKNPALWQAIRNMGAIAATARAALAKGDIKKLGRLMNLNQTYLRWLGVSSPKLEGLIRSALDSGALGAKLSGAGRGGCIVAVYATKAEAQSAARKIKGAFAVRIS
ncbi:mevalonate kinase [Candidatus Woesearchaeota archaeon]|nr:mevalonate kinase [Candidatus Woesearchaeota archaeon]